MEVSFFFLLVVSSPGFCPFRGMMQAYSTMFISRDDLYKCPCKKEIIRITPPKPCLESRKIRE